MVNDCYDVPLLNGDNEVLRRFSAMLYHLDDRTALKICGADLSYK